MRRHTILFVEDYCWHVTNGLDVQLSRFLAGRGHDVHLLACAPAPRTPDLSDFTAITFHTYGLPERARGSLRSACYVAAKSTSLFRRLHRRYRFDLVVLYQVLSAVGIQAICNAHRIPNVAFFLSPWHREYEIEHAVPSAARSLQSRLRRLLQQHLLRRATGIVTISRYMNEMLRDITHTKAPVVPLGVDVRRFAPPRDKAATRRRLELPMDRPVVFTVRRLVRRMGLDNLIRAAQIVLERHPDVLFVIGGRGPQMDELKRLGSALGIEKSVTFKGFIPPDDLAAYYQAADLFVLPTASLEGFGMVITEAMACGVPVVGTPVGAIPELLGQITPELLAADASHIAIADRIDFALADARRLAEIRSRCREFVVRTYSWDVAGPKIEAELLRIATPCNVHPR